MMKKGVDGQDECIEKHFLRKAMAATHVQYGQPAKGPELEQ
jgi:hypothetical protein